jgi:hypothetical protein
MLPREELKHDRLPHRHETQMTGREGSTKATQQLFLQHSLQRLQVQRQSNPLNHEHRMSNPLVVDADHL